MFLALAGIVVLVAFGTAGYVVIERMPLVDAIYMTVITISTVGFGEVKPLDTNGRIFTMVLIFTGVGTAFYIFAIVTEIVVGGQLREMIGRSAMNRRINQQTGHVIVCGYGRFGTIVVDELRRNGMTVVVVETNPAREAELIRENILYVLGSALEEDVLEQAGIQSASDIVVATASDPDNVYISLSARSKNPGIRIHARAESEIGLKHLQLAGADQAISSYQWSAVRIANAIARPSVVDFLNLILPGRGEEIGFEEVLVPLRSPLAGKTIATVEQENERVRIVALKRDDTPISLLPGPGTELRAGDLLIAIGSRANLRKLAETLET
ncbi:MAG TPA: potassium channel protein [Candidatus Binataceae bacterium]|nr:potassium channel protein [Candidatus Binataceae bacterium]